MKNESKIAGLTTHDSIGVQEKMKKPSTYTVDGRKFIVTPVFYEDGRESLGSILMRLMKSEVKGQLS